jgi:putative FmdB family regulatory protein
MPHYEYACVQCGNRFEILQRFGDEPLRICDVCGGDLRKVFHPAGIVFKGSGFYKTDSRQGSSAGKKSGEGSEPKSSEGRSSDRESSDRKSSEPKGEGQPTAKPDKREATS